MWTYFRNFCFRGLIPPKSQTEEMQNETKILKISIINTHLRTMPRPHNKILTQFVRKRKQFLLVSRHQPHFQFSIQVKGIQGYERKLL